MSSGTRSVEEFERNYYICYNFDKNERGGFGNVSVRKGLDDRTVKVPLRHSLRGFLTSFSFNKVEPRRDENKTQSSVRYRGFAAKFCSRRVLDARLKDMH